MPTDRGAPLVVTLALDPAAQARLDAERTRLFPVGRTRVGAHLTLFHAVPGTLLDQVQQDLVADAARMDQVRVTGVLPLGRGAAYAVESTDLVARHRRLQQAWWPHLTRQDQQRLRPHVTVQNKVDPAVARETVAALRATFAAYDVAALGYVVHRYDGGPWTELSRIPFRP